MESGSSCTEALYCTTTYCLYSSGSARSLVIFTLNITAGGRKSGDPVTGHQEKEKDRHCLQSAF